MAEKLLQTFGAQNFWEWLLKLLGAMVAMLLPIYNIMAAIVALIILDFISGVSAAIAVKDKFQASKIKKTVAKFIFYNVAVMSAFVVEKFLAPELPLIKIVGAFIGMTEFFSILRNLKKILGLDFTKAIKLWLTGRKSDWGEVFNEAESKQKNERKESD